MRTVVDNRRLSDNNKGSAISQGHHGRETTQNAENINQERSVQNQYYDCISKEWRSHNDRVSLMAAEKKAYSVLFQDKLNRTNEVYIRQRHTERCKTIDDLLKNKTTAPESTLLQIGNKDDLVANMEPDKASELLRGITDEFIAWHQKKYPQIVILDAAIHVDEATPHVHLRKCYCYKNNDGLFEPKQDKCLEQMGVQLLHPDQKLSKSNNRKAQYTKEIREKFQQICIERGFEIETEPLENSKDHLTQTQYKAKQEDKHLAELQKQIEDKQREFDELVPKVVEFAELVKQFSDKQTHDFFYKTVPDGLFKQKEILRPGLEETPSGHKEGSVNLYKYQWNEFIEKYEQLSKMAESLTKLADDIKTLPHREAAAKGEYTKAANRRKEADEYYDMQHELGDQYLYEADEERQYASDIADNMYDRAREIGEEMYAEQFNQLNLLQAQVQQQLRDIEKYREGKEQRMRNFIQEKGYLQEFEARERALTKSLQKSAWEHTLG